MWLLFCRGLCTLFSTLQNPCSSKIELMAGKLLGEGEQNMEREMTLCDALLPP